MTKLYLDCDGVILDTINMSYKMLKEKGIEREEEKKDFYRNLSWEELIIEAGEINNSIEKIKELTKVYDVEILTHVISEGEIIAKENYFKEVLPEVKVIAVPKEVKKAKPKDIFIEEQENILKKLLGTVVTIKQGRNKKGKIEIEFKDNDELERILELFKD